MKKPNRLTSAIVAAVIGIPLGGALALGVTVPAGAAIRICNAGDSQGSLGVQSAFSGRWSSLRPGQCTSGVKRAVIPNGHYGLTPFGYHRAGESYKVNPWTIADVRVRDSIRRR